MPGSAPGRGLAQRDIIKSVLSNATSVLVSLVILFSAAGTVMWWEAWVYTGMVLISSLISSLILVYRRPELVRERARAGSFDNVEGWDRILLPLTSFIGPVIALVIAGLDFRFSLSPELPLYVQWFFLIVILFGRSISSWAMVQNPFFSSRVRIQSDRGHTVFMEGPYKAIRHPGYAGGLISWIAAPFFFSSWLVIIPALFVVAGTILRTYLEDRTLHEDLPGYAEYAQKVKYRLISGIW